MIIPHSQLDPETLQNLLEEYATRDGTDYGEREMSLESKVVNLRRQLESKVVVIWFDPGEESVNLILAEDIPSDFPEGGVS